MLPVIPAQQKLTPLAVEGRGRSESVSKFSSYMEKKLANERQEKGNVFGAQQGSPRKAAFSEESGRGREQAEPEGEDRAAGIAALLAQFVAELQQAAAANADSGPGEWTFTLPDAALLEKMAVDAGMGETELGLLMQQMEEQGGQFSLVEFLDTFARHFEALSEQTPVAVPETDLPLLQLILERLGAGAPEVARISEAAVRGDNTLDLEKFLAGLQELQLQGENPTVLTQVESEQLQGLLASAGVSETMQRSLLPELTASLLDPEVEAPPVHLGMERLKNLLEQAVADVKANRLQADLPSFLADLQTVLSEAGFAARDLGWSPAVQEAVTAVFEKLLESVDLAQVKLQPGTSRLGEEKISALADDAEGEAWEELLAGLDEAEAGEADALQGNGSLAGEKDGGQQSGAGFTGEGFGEEGQGLLSSGAATTAKNEAGLHLAPGQVARPFTFVPNMPPGLQQHTFAQLSQGLLQGLRNNEHHLVMKLYPKELGEVRVELMVRDEQIAVSFAMENSKVKEVLESNMEQFKQNMEKQGFVLGECMVSVGNQQDGGEAWREFQAAWREQGVARRAAGPVGADELYPQGSYGRNLSEKGVDLFA